jgi:hypothetical protein
MDHQDLETTSSEKPQRSDPEDQFPVESPSEHPQETKVDLDAYPEGGLQAWLCIAGGFCAIFCSFGWINCTIAKALS